MAGQIWPMSHSLLTCTIGRPLPKTFQRLPVSLKKNPNFTTRPLPSFLPPTRASFFSSHMLHSLSCPRSFVLAVPSSKSFFLQVSMWLTPHPQGFNTRSTLPPPCLKHTHTPPFCFPCNTYHGLKPTYIFSYLLAKCLHSPAGVLGRQEPCSCVHSHIPHARIKCLRLELMYSVLHLRILVSLYYVPGPY